MRRFALLIGCNAGLGLTPLMQAQHDASRVQAMLLRHAAWTVEDETIQGERIVLLQGDVTPQGIDGAVATLTAKLRDDDFMFVYYAGHAGAHNGEYVLLLPGDRYPVKKLYEPFVTGQALRGSLLVLDTCFSEQATRSVLDRVLKLFERDPRPSAAQGIEGARAVFAASAFKQPARERGTGGILTSAFLSGCEFGGDQFTIADGGVVSLARLSEYVEGNLKARGQHFKSVIYGGTFDVKTLLDWRLRKGGHRRYVARSFVMLPEHTRSWYRSEPGRELTSAAWSVNPMILALGVSGQSVQVVRLDHAERKFEKLADLPVSARRHGIKLSPDGRYVVVHSESDDDIQVYPVESRVMFRQYAVRPDQFVVTAHNRLVTHEAHTGAVKAWSLSEPNQPVAAGMYPGTYSLRHLRAYPDGMRVLAGGSADGSARIWALTDIQDEAQHLHELPCQVAECEQVGALGEQFREVRRVAVSHSGAMIAVGFGGTGRVRVWSSSDLSAPLSQIAFAHNGNFITALEFDWQDAWLASGCGGGRVFLTSLHDETEPRLVWEAVRSDGREERITALAFSPSIYDPVVVIGTSSGRVVACGIGMDTFGESRELGDAETRGMVQRVGMFALENQPPQVIIAAQKGLECWDFEW